MRLVIIGGDAAGMSAASQAKRLAPKTEVVVLEKTMDVSYGACGLPYKLPDGQNMEDLRAVSVDTFREERKIDVRLGHTAQKVQRQEKKVVGTADNGPFEVGYDRLIIAAGARVSHPPIFGLEELLGRGVFTLKTLEDGRKLKQALLGRPKTVTIIGGGYIGLEASEGFRQQGLQVRILEAMPQILPFLTEKMRDHVHSEAERQGIIIHEGTRLEKLQKSTSGEILVETSEGNWKTDIVLLATGIRPNSELAAEAGLQLGDQKSIAVDATLRTSDETIFAAGDCADALHGITGKSVWIPLALRANRTGKLAGGNALGRNDPAPPVMGTAVFKFFNLQIARTGLTFSEAKAAGYEPVAAEIQTPSRPHYYTGGGRLLVSLLADRQSRQLLGGVLVGSESAAHRVDTLAACLHAHQTVENLYEMDLAYAPPFSTAWSPFHTCASQLSKKLSSS